jgi:hypothetical protein
MANMKASKIAPGDWITVGTTRCVVSKVYAPDQSSAVCLVVFNKSKPTTHDLDWDGEKWFFPERADFDGYGRISDPYVQQLIRGK